MDIIKFSDTAPKIVYKSVEEVLAKTNATPEQSEAILVIAKRLRASLDQYLGAGNDLENPDHELGRRFQNNVQAELGISIGNGPAEEIFRFI